MCTLIISSKKEEDNKRPMNQIARTMQLCSSDHLITDNLYSWSSYTLKEMAALSAVQSYLSYYAIKIC